MIKLSYKQSSIINYYSYWILPDGELINVTNYIETHDGYARDSILLQYGVPENELVYFRYVSNRYKERNIKLLKKLKVPKEIIEIILSERTACINYCIEKLGWIRIFGDVLQLPTLNTNNLSKCAKGLLEIYGESLQNETFDIWDTRDNYKHYRNLPFDYIEYGNIKAIKEHNMYVSKYCIKLCNLFKNSFIEKLAALINDIQNVGFSPEVVKYLLRVMRVQEDSNITSDVENPYGLQLAGRTFRKIKNNPNIDINSVIQSVLSEQAAMNANKKLPEFNDEELNLIDDFKDVSNTFSKWVAVQIRKLRIGPVNAHNTYNILIDNTPRDNSTLYTLFDIIGDSYETSPFDIASMDLKQAYEYAKSPKYPIGDEENIVYTFPDKWTIRKVTVDSANIEGELMQNCIGYNHKPYLADGSEEIYSLRDPLNKPHVSFSFLMKYNPPKIDQILGKQNEEPIPEYSKRVYQYLGTIGYKQPAIQILKNLNTVDDLLEFQKDYKDLLNPNDPLHEAKLHNGFISKVIEIFENSIKEDNADEFSKALENFENIFRKFINKGYFILRIILHNSNNIFDKFINIVIDYLDNYNGLYEIIEKMEETLYNDEVGKEIVIKILKLCEEEQLTKSDTIIKSIYNYINNKKYSVYFDPEFLEYIDKIYNEKFNPDEDIPILDKEFYEGLPKQSMLLSNVIRIKLSQYM